MVSNVKNIHKLLHTPQLQLHKYVHIEKEYIENDGITGYLNKSTSVSRVLGEITKMRKI